MTDSLLSRLQSLSAPSREIDEEIALANGWTTFSDEDGTYWCGPNYRLHMAPPHYTGSVDAALALVPPNPPGNFWHVGLDHFSDGWYGMIELRIDTGPIGPQYRGDQCVNGAIALLIAIMKAKEKSK